MAQPRRLKKNAYIELSLTSPDKPVSSRTEAQAFFIQHGILPRDLVFSKYPNGRIRLAVFMKSLRLAEKINAGIKRVRRPLWRGSVRILEEEDWLHKWKEDYHTHPVASRFMIVPSWEKEQWVPQRRHPIILDPGSAFGSGMHESTKLALRLMEGLAGTFGDCLDAGAGTGVLAVAAHRLGAKHILGVESDPEAAKIASKNLKLNGCLRGKILCRDIRKLKSGRAFDLICANLWPKLLIAKNKKWPQLLHPKGHLIVSGILRKDAEEFLKSFRDKKLRLMKKLMGKRWTAVLYGRAGLP